MTSTTTSPQRPNIVLIFMDDMGYGDLGCTGSPLIRTPRMDSVAEDGMTFTQMYSAAPTCTPSRAALLTGRYAQRVGLPRVIFPDDPAGLSDQEVTIAEVLGEQGRSEEHTSELQSRGHLVCRLLLEKKKITNKNKEDSLS